MSSSRRDFVKGAVLAAAPAVRPSWGRSSPNDVINVAVAGFRGRGKDHYRAYAKMPGVRVVCLCDIDERLFPGAVADIEKLCVWGNHSPTMFPDVRFATIGGQPAKALVNDDTWYRDTYIPTVGKRGAAIIEARGLSSAASAANAAIDHVRDWVLGTHGKWVTMGIASDGQYGIPKDVMFGFPVVPRSRLGGVPESHIAA